MSSSEEVKNKDDKDLEEIDEIKPTPRPKKKNEFITGRT